MFRLLFYKCASKPSINQLVIRNHENSRFYDGIKSSHNIFLFNQKRTINTAELAKKSTRKKRKKYNSVKTAVIQVTETSSRQTTTTVQKLKAKKLADFIDAPNGLALETATTVPAAIKHLEYNKFNVDMLENENYAKFLGDAPIVFVDKSVNELNLTKDNLQEIIDSYNAYKDCTISSVPLEESFEEEIVEEDHHDLEEHIIPEPIIENIPDKRNSKEKTLKTNKKDLKNNRFKSKLHKSIELEKLSKQKSLAVSLGAYLDCCVSNGMLNRGFATLLNYRYKYKKFTSSSLKISDITLYNILLHGYADKSNFTKIKEILSICKEDNIQMNPQTFAAVFECLGRISENASASKRNQFYNEDNIVKNLHRCYSEAVKYNFTLNDIVDKSIFERDQRDMVLKAIRIIEPNFEPCYSPTDLQYSNKLLDNLNENVKDINFNVLDVTEKMEGSEIMESKAGFSQNQLHALAKEQLGNELDGYITIKSIENFPEPSTVVLQYRKKLADLQKEWKNMIISSYNRDLNTIRSQTQSKSHRSINLLPYLRALEVEEYAEILLKEIRMLAEGSETYSPTVSQLYKNLGNKVQMRYHMDQKKNNGLLQKTGQIYGQYCDILANGNSSDNSRQCWQRLVYLNKNDGPSMEWSEKQWPNAAQIGVGKFLYQILMRDLKIDVNLARASKSKSENLLPAFYTLFRNQGRLVKEEVKPHPVLSKLYKGSQQETLTFDANLIPMLSPPQPWSTSKNGGYLLAKSDLIRLPQQAMQQLDRIETMKPQDLYPSLDSLNQLAAVPWKVNTEVLDVIIKIFNNGGNDKLDVPPPPQALAPLKSPDNETELTKAEKFNLFRQKLLHRRKQAEMYSLWCDALYRLSLANHFRDKVFWLPHNMDFRGRVYPVPPHLNHLGSDLARSLLVFHQAKPLGVDGFSWLKLHCINLTGIKKRNSVRERLLYAEEVMDDILDSADNPLTGRMWWTKSDEPWQTLATCMEIAKVHRCPDPTTYMSSFPIHQDGSCNGLQHYAALGRDTAGAISVNLAPADVPQDVYSGVANLVEKARQKDANEGVEVAKVLSNFVRRKVIKQTVMTTVYGVTRYGARLQIAKQLKDIDDFPQEWVWRASTYLTVKTFESLREMFTSTKEIQDWFTDCARMISTVCGQNVEWVTPLGLPVVQPYNRQDKHKSVNLRTNKLHEHFNIDMFEKPNIMKQKNAFPPNFIHSLDSSHMMLTSLNCEKQGLTFVSVHDCYWTHACTVPEMNKICREQFVALHSQPILEDLSEFMVNKYSYNEKDFSNDGSVSDMSKRKLNRLLTMVPEKGDFDLENVLRSVYFFS